MESFPDYFSLHSVLIAICFGLFTYHIYNTVRYRSPPGPWYVPFIGHWKIYTSKAIHRKVAALSEIYGPVVQIKVGPSTAVFLNNINVVIEALVKKKSDFAGRPRMKSAAIFSQNGKGLFFANYSATWKFHKRIAGKAVRYYLQGINLEEILNDICLNVFENIAKEKGPFSLTDYVEKLVTHMMFNMCFRRKCKMDDPDVERFLRLSIEVNQLIDGTLLEDMIPAISYVYKSQGCKRFERVMEEYQEFLGQEVKQHKDTYDSSNLKDYTDTLLFAREEAEAEGRPEEAEMLSDFHIKNILLDILFAGLDANRFVLDWFFSFMVEHPTLQEKCREEIDRAMGERKFPSATDRSNMCFTEACIMETMRMGSFSAIGIPHSTICDTTVGGYDIPKGTTVFINHWALHNDASFWKNVDKFDPYRYLTKDGKLNTKPENWLPFSAGRRVCLGETVARTELLLIVSHFLKNFRFKAPSGVNHVTRVRWDFRGVELPAPYKVVAERNF